MRLPRKKKKKYYKAVVARYNKIFALNGMPQRNLTYKMIFPLAKLLSVKITIGKYNEQIQKHAAK